MSFASTSRRWEWLARKDPLWAILTDDSKAGGRWAVDEFFATGEREIAAVFAHLARLGAAPIDRSVALDFGCGVGRLTRALATRFDEVHGIDVSPTMIALAHRHHPDAARLRFIHNEAPHLRALPTAHYAFVYSSVVLQHIAYPASITYVRELMRVAKPGGLIVFQIPTEDRTRLALRVARSIVRGVARRVPAVRPGLVMDMNPVAYAEVVRAGERTSCQLVDAVRTNSAGSAANGALEFYRDERGERLVSTQFTFRRRVPLSP